MEEIPLPRILTITPSADGDSMVIISVADTRTGIPDSLMDQLFTPFATKKKTALASL